MTRKPHIPESILIRIWQEQRFQPDRLQTMAGLPVQVIRRGQRNEDNGPDFKNALLRIGDHVAAGAVELHLEWADWYAHGHHADPNYNQTILHVVLWAGQPGKPQTSLIRTANGAEVPTVFVEQSLTEALETLLARWQEADARRRQKFDACRSRLGARPVTDIQEQLRQLGKERLIERARRFGAWLQPLTPPFPPQGGNPSKAALAAFQQVLYEAICEGLGYASNKQPFLELARRLPLDRILRHLPDDSSARPAASLHWIQAMLFGVAGLLPQSGVQTSVCVENDPETAAYLSELRSLWKMLPPCLDVKPLTPEDWHFFRLRPPNFPTRRIAALSYLLLNYAVQPVFESYLRLFALLAAYPAQTAQHLRLLERTFAAPAAGYWQGRYLFGKAVFSTQDHIFLGASRIRDLLISAVLPVFLMYARQTGQADLEAQILNLFDIFPAPEGNRVTQTVATQLFAHRKLPKTHIRTAAMYQGMLHLYRHYCALPACAECPLG